MNRLRAERSRDHGVTMYDLDSFADLDWERDTVDQAERNRNGRKETNLTAQIEAYLRSHL